MLNTGRVTSCGRRGGGAWHLDWAMCTQAKTSEVRQLPILCVSKMGKHSNIAHSMVSVTRGIIIILLMYGVSNMGNHNKIVHGVMSVR